jgi:hypothetical protein
MRRWRPRADIVRKRGLSNPIIPDRSTHGDGATLPHSGFVQWMMLRRSGTRTNAKNGLVAVI